MKKKIFVYSVIGAGMLLTSCQYTQDPNATVKNLAIEYFNKYYQENPSLPKEALFYFDLATTKGVKVSEKDGTTNAEYLGLLNFSTFKFSENPSKYFVDLGNLPITMVKGEESGSFEDITIGDFYSKSGGFNAANFAKHIPFVLHEKGENGEILTYSKIAEDGIANTGLKEAYDSNFFFISDFSIDIGSAGEAFSDYLDYTGKDLAILRKDIYSILDAFIDSSDFGKFKEILDFGKILRTAYKMSNGLDPDGDVENKPDLVFNATHKTSLLATDERQVVPGPNGQIASYITGILQDEGDEEISIRPAIWDFENIYFSEGITQVCFQAFEAKRDEEGVSTSKNRNFYLPSTLQEIPFGSFANLDINTMYVSRTKDADNNYRKFNTMSLEGIKFEIMGKEHELYPSFHDTDFEKIYFEDFANENLSTFPFDQTRLTTADELKEAVHIYHVEEGDRNLRKFDSLEESFTYYEEVNPFMQINLSEDVTSYGKNFDCDLTSLPRGKKLYLPYLEFSRSDKENRMYDGNYAELHDATPENATLRMTLQNDLDVEGDLIVGSQVGLCEMGSGASVGKFATIDLNGHTLKLKSGSSLKLYGLIYDSSADHTGELILENGADLDTNITINDFVSLDDVIRDVENGVKPFSSYNLSSIRAPMTVNAGARVSGYFDYADVGSAIENHINLIGDDNSACFIKLKEGTLKYDGYLTGDENTKIVVNDFEFLTVGDTKYSTADIGFTLSASQNVFRAKEITVNAHLIENNGSIAVDDLILTNGAKLISTDYTKFEIKKSISFEFTPGYDLITLCGKFKADPQYFEAIYTAIYSNEGSLQPTYSLLRYEDGEVVSDFLALNVVNGDDDSSFAQLFFKFDYGYYYLYGDSYQNGELHETHENKVLARYGETDTTWRATFNSAGVVHEDESVDTPITDRTINHFNDVAMLEYVLTTDENGTSWQELNPPVDGIYTIGNNKFIRVDDQMIKGNVDPQSPKHNAIFVSSSDNTRYLYYNYSWIPVMVFDQGYICHALTGLMFAYIDGDYQEVENHARTYHAVDYQGNRYVFTKYASGSYGLDQLEPDEYIEFNRKVCIKNDAATRAFLEGKYWAKGDTGAIGYGYIEFDNRCYFYNEGNWYASVNGDYADRYVQDVDTHFGVLRSSVSRRGIVYDFVFKEGDNLDDPYEFLHPEAKIVIDKENYSEIWEKSDFKERDSFTAYRYITIDGDKYLYYAEDAEEEGATVRPYKRRFEFDGFYTPAEPGAGSGSITEKYAFILMKVRFYDDEGVLGDPTIVYIRTDGYGEENAIVAGDTSDPNNEKYLAIAIFGPNNPINEFTGMMNMQR